MLTSDNLDRKNVLLFVPNGRGNYGTAIENELLKRGAKVWVFDERPSSGTYGKIAIRIAKNQLEGVFLSYLEGIVKECNGITFDYVIVIRAEAFTPKSVLYLKRSFNSAYFVLYLWDSINNTNTSAILPFFDRTLSFEPIDCEKHGLIHRPLFYIDAYRDISELLSEDIDVLFVAKLHSDRYLFAKRYESELKRLGLSTYFYFYLQSRLLFYKMKISSSNLKGAKVSDINYKTISAKEVADLMRRSRVSLDVQHPTQTGLTMRTLEVLGAKRKLITTNLDIVKYDFYDPANIMVVNRDDVKVDMSFISSPFSEIPMHIYMKYSLSGWLNDILGIYL
jgi:hypothetical protein